MLCDQSRIAGVCREISWLKALELMLCLESAMAEFHLAIAFGEFPGYCDAHIRAGYRWKRYAVAPQCGFRFA